jgi:hypothetical protein
MSPYLTPDLEGGQQHLARAISDLPTHEPDPSGWDALAAQLAGEQAIAQAVPHLPSHEPADDTWLHLADRLDQLAAPVPLWQPRQRRRSWQLGLAASVLLLLVAGLAWWRQPTTTPVVAVAPPLAVPTGL